MITTRDSTEPESTSNASNGEADPVGWKVISPTSAYQVRQIECDDLTLTYAEQGKGELVILVHGALGDYRTWSPRIASLAQQYHVISYSRRHHHPNTSPVGALDYAYRRHVADLISLIHALKLGPAHLVGHSYGATVAALVAIERPEMVNSLILGEPGLFSIFSEVEGRVSARLHRIALHVVQRLCETGDQKLAVREYLNIVTGKDALDKLPIEAQLVIKQNAHTLGPMLRTYFAPTEFDRQRARTVDTPTLIITGEFSPAPYRIIAQDLHRCIPNSELFMLAGASHGLQLENPAAFDNAVFDFLSRNEMAVKREGN